MDYQRKCVHDKLACKKVVQHHANPRRNVRTSNIVLAEAKIELDFPLSLLFPTLIHYSSIWLPRYPTAYGYITWVALRGVQEDTIGCTVQKRDGYRWNMLPFWIFVDGWVPASVCHVSVRRQVVLSCRDLLAPGVYQTPGVLRVITVFRQWTPAVSVLLKPSKAYRYRRKIGLARTNQCAAELR